MLHQDVEGLPWVVHPFGFCAVGNFFILQPARIHVAVEVVIVGEVLKPLMGDAEACFFVDLSVGRLYGCFASFYLSTRYLVVEVHRLVWVGTLGEVDSLIIVEDD